MSPSSPIFSSSRFLPGIICVFAAVSEEALNTHIRSHNNTKHSLNTHIISLTRSKEITIKIQVYKTTFNTLKRRSK